MSSAPHEPQQLCQGKVRHDSFVAAKHAMKLLLRKRNRDQWPMKPYSCNLCGGFHVGHMRVKDIGGRR